MSRAKKIMFTWLGFNLFYLVTLWLLPHRELPPAPFVSYSVQTLLMIISYHVYKFEPVRKNRCIFLNFAVFFSLVSISAHVINFIGKDGFLLPDDVFVRGLLDQFIFRIGYFALLAFSIVYITIDLLLRDFSTSKKYILTTAVVGGFTLYYYFPFFADPSHGRHTEEALQFHEVDSVYYSYQKANGVAPTEDQLVTLVPEMYTYHGPYRVGILYPEEREKRVREIYPYLEGLNYMILVYKPLHTNAIQMSVLCIGFILLFFGYQYMKDPPQGAYIEKIMFLLLVFCTLELLHAYSFIHSLQWSVFTDLMNVGSYVSVMVLLLLTAFFGLRLRFITSAKGEFYEQELVASPGGITRWRDLLDNVVIEKFFNRKLLLGRLMVDPRDRRMSH